MVVDETSYRILIRFEPPGGGYLPGEIFKASGSALAPSRQGFPPFGFRLLLDEIQKVLDQIQQTVTCLGTFIQP